MSNPTERLLSLKDEIEQSKIDQAKIQGAINSDIQRLKNEFQCRTVEMGKTKQEELKNRKVEITHKLEKIVEKLEATYGW